MITARNEFETIPAFTHIAGCSLGTWSDYDSAKALVDAAVSISSDSSVLKLKAEFEEISEDDETGILYEFQDDATQFINDHDTLEDYCSLSVDDGEWIVRPYIDDELPSFDDYQEEFQGDHILIVNDHGNTTCQRWDYSTNEYKTIWDVV